MILICSFEVLILPFLKSVLPQCQKLLYIFKKEMDSAQRTHIRKYYGHRDESWDRVSNLSSHDYVVNFTDTVVTFLNSLNTYFPLKVTVERKAPSSLYYRC